MSEWSIKKKTRTMIIIVKEVISYKEEGPAGFPIVEIFDRENRKHRITALDILSYEFKKIGPGAKIALTLKESIIKARII